MKFWGWILRIVIAVLGIGLFLLQSQFAKKSILEFIVNQPLKQSTFHIEVDGVRGLFPFQFTVGSLDLKEGENHLVTLSDISVVWLMPALVSQQIKVNVAKGNELRGDATYVIGKHALFANIQGKGLSLLDKGAITLVVVDFPTLDLLKGQVSATLHDGQEPVTLTLELEELDEDRLKIRDIILTGKEIKGKGHVMVYPRQNLWEGEAEVSIANLAPYDRWFQKELVGSATLKCHKTLKRQAELDLHLKQFHYGDFGAKSLRAEASIDGREHLKLNLQGQEAILNNIPMTKLSASGNLDKSKATFDFVSIGHQNISFQTQGVIDLPTPETPQTQITLIRAELGHPMHQFSLKQPATFVWGEGDIQAQRIWLTTGGGMITIQDLIVGNQLSGDIAIDRLPLTLLRVIDPDWVASGYLSGKGKLKGTMEKPDVELFLEGKSLQWGVPTKSRHAVPNRILGIDISSTFTLSQGFLAWQVKLVSGRLLTLISQGKFSVDQWYPTAESSLEATLKGRGDMGIISLFMPSEDLIQGQASFDLTAKGIVKSPMINGQVSVANGLYENAAFGTLIKNIKIQGKASGDVLTMSSISGQDSAKGRVHGQGSVKFTSLLNPEVDLQLKLDQLIVVQNDEITGKARGILRLQGSLWGDDSAKAKITGDVVLQPLEVRLDEYPEKIVTIKLFEKKKNGSYQISVEHHKQAQLQKNSSLFPLDIKLNSPGQVYLRGYGFDAQWKAEMRAIGTITEPQLIGELTLVRGKFDLLGKPLKLSEGRITYSQEPRNDPLLSILGTRDVGEITATMRIEGRASDPKITFSSSPTLPQEEILARLLFGRGIESMSVTQSLLLANALSAFKGKNNLNLTDKIRSAFGLDVLEFKERKAPEEDDFKSGSQQVSVGKQITDKVYLSLDQSVSGDGGTTATVQLDVTSSLKVEADVGGDKNTGVGFAWVKKY